MEDEETGKLVQQYTTLVFDSKEHEGNGWYKGKVVCFIDLVYRILDDEFDASQTVELLYVRYESHLHFMHLKRKGKMSSTAMTIYRRALV